MKPSELKAGTGLEGDLPQPLVDLLDYRENRRGIIVCDFELVSDGRRLVSRFLRDEELAKSFAVFGVDGMLSLYALWLDEGAVPVFLDADWERTGVLARDLREFIALLTLGRERLGMIDSWHETHEECSGTDEFRAWARDRLGTEALSADEAREIITRARAEHPDLKQWLEERRSTA